MNINDDYQKRREQTTSFLTGEIIEPKKKIFRKQHILSTIKFVLLGILGETKECK